jgi:hypothetical protein
MNKPMTGANTHFDGNSDYQINSDRNGSPTIKGLNKINDASS